MKRSNKTPLFPQRTTICIVHKRTTREIQSESCIGLVTHPDHVRDTAPINSSQLIPATSKFYIAAQYSSPFVNNFRALKPQATGAWVEWLIAGWIGKEGNRSSPHPVVCNRKEGFLSG